MIDMEQCNIQGCITFSNKSLLAIQLLYTATLKVPLSMNFQEFGSIKFLNTFSVLSTAVEFACVIRDAQVQKGVFHNGMENPRRPVIARAGQVVLIGCVGIYTGSSV